MLDACVAVKAKEAAVMLLVYLVRRLGAVAGKSFLWMHLHMQHAKTSAVVDTHPSRSNWQWEEWPVFSCFFFSLLAVWFALVAGELWLSGLRCEGFRWWSVATTDGRVDHNSRPSRRPLGC